MEKKYPIGGYAPGNYHNRCSTCNRSFFGDKQAVQCESCALEAKARFDALPIEEQMQLIKRNGQIAQVMFECPVSPERDLILRIVEQWGNVVAMPQMEQWLKDYAATKVPTSAVWVKASVRLPEQTKRPVLYIVKWFDDRMYVRTWTANQLADWVKNTPSLEYFWLDESGTPATPADQDNALYETRLALRMLLKVFKNDQISKEQEKYYSQAEGILKKHGKITDVLRSSTPAAGREESDAVKLELKQKTKALERFVSMHETGLLPNRFVYENGKSVLAEGSGEKEGKPMFEIKPGLRFHNVHMPLHSFEVINVAPGNNILTVRITSPSGDCWTETDWNLKHTKWAFEKGEYFNPLPKE